MKVSTFISKRYALLLCYLVLLIAETKGKNFNLEKVYSLWLKSRPSRTTFANLIGDLKELQWVEKSRGLKRSAYELKIDKKAILEALQLKPNFNLRRTWVYEEGIFDVQRLSTDALAEEAKAASRMSTRWNLQEELNEFLYPDTNES